MRLLGQLDERKPAETLAAYLYANNIECQIEEQDDGKWALWIWDDDDLEPAQAAYEAFLQNPRDPRFQEGAQEAMKRLAEEQKEDKGSRYRKVDARTARTHGDMPNLPFLTVGLMVFSIGTFLFQMMVEDRAVERLLFMAADAADWQAGNHLEEIRNGQVWRILTPIFLHFTIIHIAFNMIWLKVLGSAIEEFDGTMVLFAQVLVFGIAGNIGQYIVAGPYFGGMSGVVYGLFGYVWIRSRYDRSVPYGIDATTAAFMIGWFFLCLTGLMGPIANMAHAVGLVGGIVWASIRIRRIPFVNIQG